MLQIVRWVAVVCAVLGSIAMGAQSALVIAGTVYEDRMALAVRPHFKAAEGVTVKLYRDNGDSLPSVQDVAVATTRTTAAGTYAFPVSQAGSYWVVVDSRSFRADAWPEQTFGPSGSLCARPDGNSRTTLFEGSCFGGRTGGGSDDANALATSEHLALIKVDQAATGVDFAFSYDAVTSIADQSGRQGTLRQFLLNANAVHGPNRMRFVPLEPARAVRETIMGLPPRWWTIALTTALPEVTDDDTIIDGMAYNFLSPSSVSDANPGRLGESAAIRLEEREISRLEKPELEIIASGDTGIICNVPCGIRSLSLHGAATGIITRGDSRIDHVLIGADPDAVPTSDGGQVGLQIERGSVMARHLLVTTQTRFGVTVSPGARLDGERLDISRCGQPLSGAGIVLLSSGSTLRSSTITANPGAAIVLGATDGSAPATGNTIDGNTISGNQAGVVIGPGSSRNMITRNDIVWNRLGGVTITPFTTAAPRENRISANRFDENGLRPIILDLDRDDPNQLHPGTQDCLPVSDGPNGGIAAPSVTQVVITDEAGPRAVIRGRACAGQIVEIYQSYVTSGIIEAGADQVPQVRDERIANETLTQERMFVIPSIGEFNYLGATTTAADGTFEAMFPLPVIAETSRSESSNDEPRLWADQRLLSLTPRAFSAIAIDPAGNTSEMSVRRKAD